MDVREFDGWLYRSAMREEFLKEAGVFRNASNWVRGRAQAARSGLQNAAAGARRRIMRPFTDEIKNIAGDAIETAAQRFTDASMQASNYFFHSARNKLLLPLAAASTLIGAGGLATMLLLREKDQRRKALEGMGIINADESS